MLKCIRQAKAFLGEQAAFEPARYFLLVHVIDANKNNFLPSIPERFLPNGIYFLFRFLVLRNFIFGQGRDPGLLFFMGKEGGGNRQSQIKANI